jgi:hypothetical protein
MDALTGRRFIDDPASAMVINSKPITSVQTVNEMVTASAMIEISQAPSPYPVHPVQATAGKKPRWIMFLPFILVLPER